MKLLLGMWAVVGPLIGVMLGSYLSMRMQRSHWVVDNKKEEYRELLSALTLAFTDIVAFHNPMVAHTPEQQRAYAETERKALIVIRDRLFIANEVKEMDLLKRWNKATRDFDNNGDNTAFAESFGEITRSITSAAMQIIK